VRLKREREREVVETFLKIFLRREKEGERENTTMREDSW